MSRRLPDPRAVAEEVTAKHSVRLEDPVDSDTPWLDIRGLSLDTDGEVLTVEIEVDRDVAAYAEENGVDRLLEILVDVDDDTATGGETFALDAKGLDFSAEIYVCKGVGGAEVCMGDLRVAGAEEDMEYYVEYRPARWSARDEELEPTHDLFDWVGGRHALDGKTVIAEIPYSEIGIEPGQTIRVYFKKVIFEESEPPVVLMTVR